MPATRPTRPARSTGSSRRLPLVPALLGVIAVLGVVAIVASRGGDDDVPAGVEQVRPVSVSGDPLPKYESGGGDPAVGTAIPEVEGRNFAGDPVTITRDGTPKLIVFLAHWCPHCRNEVGVITGWLADQGAPEGVELVSVSTGVDPDAPNYPPSTWLEREEWPLPVLADDADQTVADAFGLSAFPYFVAVDGEGNVAARATGELGVDVLEQTVNSLRQG